MKAISIYLTCKDNTEAKKISQALLKKKLVACANIFPVNSLYLWRKKIESSEETAVVFKTLKNNLGKVEKEIKRLHSYDLPSYFIEEVEVNKQVMTWLKNELK